MDSYLLYKPNHALRDFTVASELQFHISNLRGKTIQNVNFVPVSQNNDLSLINANRQHESNGMLGFQNKAPYIMLMKFYANQDNNVTSENVIFNGSSFSNSETTIGFLASKRIQEWSRILISSPSWSYM